MIDVASLLELADFTCSRCGKPGPDTFADLAGLEAALHAVQPLPPNGGAVRMEPSAGIWRVDPAALARFGPCHRTCPRDRPAPPAPPYDLSRSVC